MKLSCFLRNVMSNFPIGHRLSCLATSQLAKAMRAEWSGDDLVIIEICKVWDLDPLPYLSTN